MAGELKRGDKDRDGRRDVARLQCLLNRVGGLLVPDGDFGAGTEVAVRFAQRLAGQAETGRAGRALLAFLAAQPLPSDLVSVDGLTFIGRFEVASLTLYQRRYLHPIKPSSASGITIGVGYDLKFNGKAQFLADWAALPPATLDRLSPLCRKAGSAADVAALADLEVPWAIAWKVFCAVTVPAYDRMTLAAFPGAAALPDHRRAVLLSLVYNRGAAMEGDHRREMRAIRTLLRQGRPDGVAEELEKMKRLWDGDPLNGGTAERLPGLLTRRDDEAAVWRRGFKPGCGDLA
jgi:hypothetical protein